MWIVTVQTKDDPTTVEYYGPFRHTAHAEAYKDKLRRAGVKEAIVLVELLRKPLVRTVREVFS